MQEGGSFVNSSYVFGYDNLSGWGERFFFTYFSQFEERPYGCIVAEVVILSLIFIISTVANVTIAFCVIRVPEMRTVTNCFVFNLAVADLLFSMSIPFVGYTRVEASWRFGDAGCRLMPYTQFVSAIVLLWTLALISVDRHKCIVVPPYRSKMAPHEAFACSATTWILSSIMFIPVAFWFREQTSQDGIKTFCTLVFPKSEVVNYSLVFMIPLVTITCILPMGLLIYNYYGIFMKILSTKNTWASSCVVLSSSNANELQEKNNGNNRNQTRRQSELSLSDIFTPWPRKYSSGSQLSYPYSSGGRQGSLSHQEEVRLNKHVKVVRVLFLNVIMVLIMWLPITIVMFLIYFDGKRNVDDQNFFLRSQHFVSPLIVAYLNTIINPFLYGMLSEQFRACLVKMWRGNKADDVTNNGTTIINNKEGGTTPSSGNVKKSSATATGGTGGAAIAKEQGQGQVQNQRRQSFNIPSVSECPNEVI